ncbi:MAG: serine hydrolase domain-containing protein [Azospirillaceae bacterium]
MTSDPGALAALADTAFAPVAEALSAGRIPGAALGLVDRGGARAVRHGGHARREPDPAPVTADTWWDLASLTKVLLTAPALVGHSAAGRLDLEAPYAAAVRDIVQVTREPGLRAMTVAALLSHTAGLPAWFPLYTYGDDPARLRAFLLQHPWPLGAPVYSDIGYMLAGILLERLEDRPLADLAPPGLAFGADPEISAATERCPWRGRVIAGTVHDENAHALGGAAGHAGLFGTVDGVLDRAHALLTDSVVPVAWAVAMRRDRGAGHGLGWATAREGWAGGPGHGPATVGHTGFTGTGLWLDPDRGLAWTLLTNRVHPTRHAETGIMDLRRAVGAGVVGAADS